MCHTWLCNRNLFHSINLYIEGIMNWWKLLEECADKCAQENPENKYRTLNLTERYYHDFCLWWSLQLNKTYNDVLKSIKSTQKNKIEIECLDTTFTIVLNQHNSSYFDEVIIKNLSI